MKRIAIAVLLLACLLPAATPGYAAAQPDFAAIPLQGSEKDCQLTGGCSKDLTVTLNALDSEYVLVEVFSMYCPICQGTAPNVNRLYELIRQSPFASRLLLLGAGADNSRYEVDVFRKKYAIPFALLADPELAFYKACGANGTPYFLLLRKDAAGKLQQLYTHSGKIDDPELFFNTILKKANLAG